MSSLIDGLGNNGTMMVVGATTDPIEVTPIQVIQGKKNIQGWASGIPTDSEDTLLFSQLNDIASMNEVFQKERRKHDRENEFWNRVKSMALQGDKLVITTKPE